MNKYEKYKKDEYLKKVKNTIDALFNEGKLLEKALQGNKVVDDFEKTIREKLPDIELYNKTK